MVYFTNGNTYILYYIRYGIILLLIIYFHKTKMNSYNIPHSCTIIYQCTYLLARNWRVSTTQLTKPIGFLWSMAIVKSVFHEFWTICRSTKSTDWGPWARAAPPTAYSNPTLELRSNCRRSFWRGVKYKINSNVQTQSAWDRFLFCADSTTAKHHVIERPIKF